MPTRGWPVGTCASPKPQSPVPTPGTQPPLPLAVGGRRRRPRGKREPSRGQAPLQAALRGPPSPSVPRRAQPPLPSRRVLHLPGCATASLLPESSSASPGSPLTSPSPQSPRKSNSGRPVGSPKRRVVAGRMRSSGDSPRVRAPGRPSPVLVAGSRGQSRGARPEPSDLPGTAGDSPETFSSSGAGVQLTSLPPPPGGQCPAGSLRPRSRRRPRPPPPFPLCQKCHSFSAFGCFAKSPPCRQELGGNARRANPPMPQSVLPRSPALRPAGEKSRLVVVTVPRAPRAVPFPSLQPSLARVAAACLCRGSSFPCS